MISIGSYLNKMNKIHMFLIKTSTLKSTRGLELDEKNREHMLLARAITSLTQKFNDQIYCVQIFF